MLKSNGECFERFKEFKALVKFHFEYKIKAFWSNSGGEFISKIFEQYLKET